MKSQSKLAIVLFFVVIILTLALIWINVADKRQTNNGQQTDEGIQVNMPKPGDTLSSPVKISGTVNGNGWTGFEGQVGVVRLFDESDNELALGILTATTDWMSLPTSFETTLFFGYIGEGDGKLVFYNENASGEPERNKTFTIPVKLTNSSAKTTTVRVYFSGNLGGQDYDCENVHFFERILPFTEAPARAALEELLLGPNSHEKFVGLFTNINEGVAIQSLTIENGVAKVDFSSELNDGVAGSCRVTAIRAQIEETLKQFPTVQSVIISVNGDSETILQP